MSTDGATPKGLFMGGGGPSSSMSSSMVKSSNSAGMSPQGKFVQRLDHLEKENKSLREDLLILQKWKASVESWLVESFGFNPDVGGVEDDANSVSSNVSRDTNGRPEENLCPVKTENESDKTYRWSSSSTSAPLQAEVTENSIVSAEGNSCRPMSKNHQLNSEGVTGIPGAETGCFEAITDPTVLQNGSNHTKVLRSPKKNLVTTGIETPANSTPLVVSEQPRCSTSALNSKVGNMLEGQMPLVSKEHTSPAIIWQSFDLQPNQIGVSVGEVADQTPCDVCHTPNPEPQNNMIFCETCNICVHQACYGVPVIPQGEWNCQPCTAKIPIAEQKCRFCTIRGGAMLPVKSPSKSSWAHVSCTWWIPGVRIQNPRIMEMVVGLPQVERSRWMLTCTICKAGKGETCCIQCCYKNCATAFHVTCAYAHGYRMDMLDDDNLQDGLRLFGFCQAHRDKNPLTSRRRRNSKDASPQKKRKIETPKKTFTY